MNSTLSSGSFGAWVVLMLQGAQDFSAGGWHSWDMGWCHLGCVRVQKMPPSHAGSGHASSPRCVQPGALHLPSWGIQEVHPAPGQCYQGTISISTISLLTLSSGSAPFISSPHGWILHVLILSPPHPCPRSLLCRSPLSPLRSDVRLLYFCYFFNSRYDYS